MPEFDKLNNSELRLECEKRMGQRSVATWMPRERMLDFLHNGTRLPDNPIDRVRTHQTGYILDRYGDFKLYLKGSKCGAVCFEHDDMQVTECQVLNPKFRYPDYPD